MTGLTGIIKFDNQGFRSDFILDIIELNTKDGLKKIGSWNSTKGINFTRSYGEIYTQIVDSLHNKTFIVTTILVRKYEKNLKHFTYITHYFV
jgi:ionotropic glutamate receptor